MKCAKLKFVTLGLLVAISLMTAAMPVLAAAPNLGIEYANNLGLTGNNADPRDAAVTIVRYLMTFLAIIAVIIVLYGGFRWMTANGNEDRVESAKRTIIAGAIGLVVILAAFAIVQFVINTASNIL